MMINSAITELQLFASLSSKNLYTDVSSTYQERLPLLRNLYQGSLYIRVSGKVEWMDLQDCLNGGDISSRIDIRIPLFRGVGEPQSLAKALQSMFAWA